MLKQILLSWFKISVTVIGLSYWSSFFAEELGPKRTVPYALGTLTFSFVFAVIIEYIRHTKMTKQKILIPKNNLN
jgi:hypothetical protein